MAPHGTVLYTLRYTDIMRRVGFITLFIALILATLIMLACGAGQVILAPNPPRDLGFDRCGENACFRGITPGITSWDEIRARFPDANFSANLDSSTPYQQVEIRNAPIRINMSFWGNKLHVEGVSLDLATPVPVWKMINFYGYPRAVSVYPVQCNTYNYCSGWSGLVELTYNNMRIYIFASDSRNARLAPNDTTDRIELVDVRQCDVTPDPYHLWCIPDEIGSWDNAWPGFASLCRIVELWATRVSPEIPSCTDW
jgi:hypothetical protein